MRILTEVAEGVDGVFPGSFDGRVNAEDEADDDRGGKGNHENVDVNIGSEGGDNGK